MKKLIETNNRGINESEVVTLLLQFMRTEIRNRLHERLRMPKSFSQASDRDLDRHICQYQQLELMCKDMPDRRKPASKGK